MLSYLKRVFTGQKTIRKNIKGKVYTFRFEGKPVFFDPIQMLTDLNYRMEEERVQRLPYQFKLDPLPTFFSLPAESDPPSVTCTIGVGEEELHVSRHTYKISNFPASFYRFRLGGEVIGVFTRIYHQPQYHQHLGLKLASMHKDSLNLSSDSWLWENEDGKFLYLEKFGQPQIWDFRDRSKLNQITQSKVNAPS
ncbi:MAG: hypothetical protein HWE15_15960 [Algoriphagus sp.]|uniref:hypothetical protein n=1 Tax=Algoriphagus sp. TaxID=1872435 RepID=UPI0017CBCE94|nr:hypothetical protein [Algoriphagus sp.]NVJ87799.1 hypothetical protein [Algoriphagus sp.]